MEVIIMEGKKELTHRILVRILVGIIFIAIALQVWNPGTESPTIQDQIYRAIFVLILVTIALFSIFSAGQIKGRLDHKGRAVSFLETGKEYKVLSITPGLKESGEYTFLRLQEGDDKNSIIDYSRNSGWLSEVSRDLRVGSIITQNEKGSIVVLT